MSRSSDAVDLDALLDLTTPWCLRVLVTLRIPELVSGGLSDVGKLASAAGCDTTALHNVLSHVAAKGVFREESPGQFVLTQAAEELLDKFRALELDLDGIGGRYAEIWSALPSHVRTGDPVYQEAFGLPFWEDLEAHPALAGSFHAVIRRPAKHGMSDADFEISGGWTGIRSIVDVGGGAGAFLADVLRRRPGLHGTLVDLPTTVAGAASLLETAGVTDRVTVSGQSFFDPLPAGADLYVLRRVLPDWKEPDQLRVLRRCADAMQPSSRLVVFGGVLPPHVGRSVTFEALVVGETKQPLSVFQEMVRSAGLEVSRAEYDPVGRFVVECRILAAGA